MFQLARQCGCTIAELGRRMSAAELSEWQAYERIDPGGEWRADLRMARICLTIAHSVGGKKEDGSDFTLDDFLFRFDREEAERENQMSIKMKLMKMTALAGGKIG